MIDKKWETLTKAQGDLEAEIIRGLLEAQEIPVVLSREGAGRAFGFTVGPMGEVEILVPMDHLHQAKIILKQYEDGSLDSSDIGDI